MRYAIEQTFVRAAAAILPFATLAAQGGQPPPGSAAAPAASEAALAREASLQPIIELALARNPDLREDRARVEAARARGRQAGRLQEPQLKYEQWGVPLRRPYAVLESNAVMLGLILTLPPPGALEARARVAEQDTRTALTSAAARRRDLRVQVRRAFADYYRADREVALHREHVDLTARLVGLARASYRSGHRAQQDVLRLNLELSRLHRDLAHIEQERISASALLNALMNRAPDAPLGPPAELTPAEAPPTSVDEELESRRAEVATARAAVSKSEAVLELVRREERWPSVTIGGDYMYMPMMEDRHGYGAMIMLNLPWLSSARSDAIEAARHSLSAERHALESVRNAVRYEARDARARFEAAKSTFEIIDRDLWPQARQNFETAQAGYGAGQGDAISLVDALRGYLDTRLDRVRSLVHLETAAADLARALGEKEGAP